MGQSKVSSVYDDLDHSRAFVHELLRDVDLLQKMIDDGRLDGDIQRIGAEQEVCFIDQYYRPAPIIMRVLEKLNDPHFTVEHAQFNGEINIDPIILESGSFLELEKQTTKLLARFDQAAKTFGGSVVLAGILPTINQRDLSLSHLTPVDRFKVLDKLLDDLRGEPFEFRIEGIDQLIARQETSMFESCNTSFQVHLQLSASEFVNAYNWSQAIAGPVLSCATNSPLLFGKRLWRETRIALFQQSIDIRSAYNGSTEGTPRVTFGSKWVKNSVTEIFKEDIVRHPVLLGTPDVNGNVGVPKLRALSIHNGTVYRWNRPCYGITEGKPHLRIENRYLPSGPSIVDQVANSAFWVGLMKGIPEKYEAISSLMDFDEARSNFIKSARMGLGAQFKWLNGKRIPAKELILDELLPIAYDGLTKAKISSQEAEKYLKIIEQRVISEKTGSQWQHDAFARLKKQYTTRGAALHVTAGMVYRQKANIPVHQWSETSLDEVKDPEISYHTVDRIMSTDLILAHPHDPLEVLLKIMEWKSIHHILIVGKKGKLKGLISENLIKAYKAENDDIHIGTLFAKEIMVKKPLSIPPDTLLTQAARIMNQKGIGSLPVVHDRKILGIITWNDLLNLPINIKQKTP